MSTASFRTPAGPLAYTDVGTGPPVVLVHGNPTSARLYRHVMRALAPGYRCVAPDHLGFGRSDAPSAASYRPAAHATRLDALLQSLALTDVTLVLHDWGGPIGLSYALRHPDRVARLVLVNTWAWPLTHRPLIQAFSRLLATAPGRAAVERANAFPRVVMPGTLGREAGWCPDWLPPYVDALDTRPRRHACWVLARSLIGETAWLRALWSHRHRLPDVPTLLCWGLDDPAFGTEATLRRWTRLVPSAQVHRRAGVGHYLPEEMGPAFADIVESFLHATE